MAKNCPAKREDGNRVKAFAVAIVKDGTVVGHVRGTNWPLD